MMPEIAMTPASGTSVVRRRRNPSPELVNRALSEMDHLMAAFEVGAAEPSAAPAPTRSLVNEPSWAPSPGMGM